MGGKCTRLTSCNVCHEEASSLERENSRQLQRLGFQYKGDDSHEIKYRNEFVAVHQVHWQAELGKECSCKQIPLGRQYCADSIVNGTGLTRANGHTLKTDCRSLLDSDGDGKCEPHEVVDAVFLLPVGEESHYEVEGGELLFPEHDHEDDDRSALEVMLRDQVKSLDEKLENMIVKVKNHRVELEDPHARDTHDFLLRKAAHIAKEAADLGVILCSDGVEAHRAIQKQVVDLTEVTNSFMQEVQFATSNAYQADQTQTRRSSRFVVVQDTDAAVHTLLQATAEQPLWSTSELNSAHTSRV